VTNVLIRDAQPDDAEAIRNVTLAAYQEYAAILRDHWNIYKRDIVATLADVRPAIQLVAERDGAVVGTVLLFPANIPLSMPGIPTTTLKWPEIRLLAVQPAMRGQGIGAALVRACIERARQSGVSAVMLHTTDMMQTAMQMYERLGFVRDTTLDAHPIPAVTIKGYRFALDSSR